MCEQKKASKTGRPNYSAIHPGRKCSEVERKEQGGGGKGAGGYCRGGLRQTAESSAGKQDKRKKKAQTLQLSHPMSTGSKAAGAESYHCSARTGILWQR